MNGEVCCICKAEPVLYFSNGKVFCKKHKAEATHRAQRGLTKWKSSEYIKQYENVGGTLYAPPVGKGSGGQRKFRSPRNRS